MSANPNPLRATLDAALSPAVRRDVKRAVEHFLRQGLIAGVSRERGGEVRFLQIGGNDGRTADPLLAFHAAAPWTGVIVEPVPLYFQELSLLHAGNARIALANLAVSDRAGELVLWHVQESRAAAYPNWTKGVASTALAHLAAHGVAEADCVAVRVPCVSPAELLSAHAIAALDILCIDVEGHEATILNAFPFATVTPRLTIFEAWHMPAADRAALRHRLGGMGLQLSILGEDGIIMRADDVLAASVIAGCERFLAELF